MCWEDIAIGRKSKGRPFSVAVAGPDTQVLKPNADRIGLIISPDAAALLCITFGTPSIANHGINIPATATPLYLDLQYMGDLLMEEVRASAGAAAVVNGVEVVLEARDMSDITPHYREARHG